MSNAAPGRPRRQQQVYRRANTSLNLTTGGDNANSDDPYVGCTSIVDKFLNSAAPASSGYESNTLPAAGSGVMNGGGSVGSSRKSSSSGGGALKDFLMGRNNTSKDLAYSSQTSGMSDSTITGDSLPSYSGGDSGISNNWALQDQSVINDLTIGPPIQQPKYSYLVGRSNTSKDLWRKPALSSNFSNVSSFHPAAPMAPPPSSLPLQSSQSTSYVGGPSRYGNNSYNPKRSSQLYENYDYQSSNNLYGDNVSNYGNNNTGSTATGSKRAINTSIGSDYQLPQTTPNHHSQLYNQPPPPSTYTNNDYNVSHNNNISNSSASAALSYEERINTALGRKVPKSSTSSTIASTQNLQKSQSYSTFDAARRDQVPFLLSKMIFVLTDLGEKIRIGGKNIFEIGYVSLCQFSNDPFQVNY